jgi:hypothetical protein
MCPVATVTTVRPAVAKDVAMAVESTRARASTATPTATATHVREQGIRQS